MELTFLGGADEIGAAGTFVEIGGRRILVDAGIRIDGPEAGRFPDLSRLRGGIDAVVITHAHLDHSGALPLVHAHFPRVPVYCTPPTIELLIGMLEPPADDLPPEEEIPCYDREVLAGLAARVEPVPFGRPVGIGGVSLVFQPAGHIPGAASVHLTSINGSVLFTGDCSMGSQLSVDRMTRPMARPDVLVAQTTCAGPRAVSRRAEERAIEALAAEVIGRGGKLLLPSFALGRAQELVVILLRAMAAGRIPEFPIYLDGSVRAVTERFSRFPAYLGSWMRRRISHGDNPLFPEHGPVRLVRRAAERQAIVDGPPACIMAGSGRLTGGASPFYAAALADDPRSFVALNGIPDEEAPDAALLRQAAGGWPHRCGLGLYHLSTHADARELKALISALEPRELVLIHAPVETRQALAATLSTRMAGRVHFPAHGARLRLLEEAPARLPRVDRYQLGEPVGGDRPLLEPDLEQLWYAALERTDGEALFTVKDLLTLWYGETAPRDRVPWLRALLARDRRYFLADDRRPAYYRVRRAGSSGPAPEGPMDPASAMKVVDQLLDARAGLYRRGAQPDRRELNLYFEFPAIARARHAAVLRQIESRTGWSVRLNETPLQRALEELASSLLPPGTQVVRAPSIHHDRKVVAVRVSAPVEAEVEALSRRMEAESGYRLQIDVKGVPPMVQKLVRDRKGRVELNRAFLEIDQAFESDAHRPYRRGLKNDHRGPFIQVAFISPHVALRFRERIETLSERLGWRIEAADRPNQVAVADVAKGLIPSEWQVTRGPAFHPVSETLRVKPERKPTLEAWEEVSARIEEATGYALDWWD